jgi:hypothetical protein
MKETEFLRKRNVIPKDGTDLIIGFDNGTEESLIGLLKAYHETSKVPEMLELLIELTESNHLHSLRMLELREKATKLIKEVTKLY